MSHSKSHSKTFRNSPLTHLAEAYEQAGKADFDYIRDVNRDEQMYIAPPSIILEGHEGVDGVLKLKDGRLLSWGDKTLRLWNENGTAIAVLKGHEDREVKY